MKMISHELNENIWYNNIERDENDDFQWFLIALEYLKLIDQKKL